MRAVGAEEITGKSDLDTQVTWPCFGKRRCRPWCTASGVSERGVNIPRQGAVGHSGWQSGSGSLWEDIQAQEE